MAAEREIIFEFIRIGTALKVAAVDVESRAGSNAKAKRELGWLPTYPTWRQGFREVLAQAA